LEATSSPKACHHPHADPHPNRSEIRNLPSRGPAIQFTMRDKWPSGGINFLTPGQKTFQKFEYQSQQVR